MIEFFKAISWPHTGLILGIIFLFLFKKDVALFIGRVKSIGKDGLTASTPEAQRENKNNLAAQELLDAIGKSIVLKELEDRIRLDMDSRGLDTKGDSVELLIRQLAANQILLEFEQIHSLIFGSQIFLLKKLNEVCGQGKSKVFLDEHFKALQEIFPDALSNWSLDQYLSFLKSRSLILFDGDNFHITNLGVEYITWIARNGRQENKPF
jgi:hypothetical protein